MMPLFNKTQKFKTLHKKWSEKLKKSGFKDIEQGEKLLRNDTDWFNRHIDTLKFENTREHFLQCEEFLLLHNFDSKRDFKIFMNYSNGRTLEQIEKLVILKKSQIAVIINKYLKLMRK